MKNEYSFTIQFELLTLVCVLYHSFIQAANRLSFLHVLGLGGGSLAHFGFLMRLQLMVDDLTAVLEFSTISNTREFPHSIGCVYF